MIGTPLTSGPSATEIATEKETQRLKNLQYLPPLGNAITVPDPTNGLGSLDRTPTAVKVDNMIRQKLRIGDPRDPAAIADGLRRMFPKDARAQDLEALGLPTLPQRFGTTTTRLPWVSENARVISVLAFSPFITARLYTSAAPDSGVARNAVPS